MHREVRFHWRRLELNRVHMQITSQWYSRQQIRLNGRVKVSKGCGAIELTRQFRRRTAVQRVIRGKRTQGCSRSTLWRMIQVAEEQLVDPKTAQTIQLNNNNLHSNNRQLFRRVADSRKSELWQPFTEETTPTTASTLNHRMSPHPSNPKPTASTPPNINKLTCTESRQKQHAVVFL